MSRRKDDRRSSKHHIYDDDDARHSRGGGMLQLTDDMVTKFSGQDSTHPVSRWVQEIEDNAEIFSWSETQKLLIARRSLSGTAALWCRSERIFKTWEDLKQAINKEFPDTVDIKTIHELMSRRKKAYNESCLDYMLIMKELGKRGKMPDYVAIKYIVDGIQDKEINKVMLYGLSTYSDLKEKLKVYEIVKEKMKSNEARFSHSSRNSKSQRERGPVEGTSSIKIRCFNCGEKNHASEDCPNRQNGRKCFNCNEFGHISMHCPAKKTYQSKSTVGGENDACKQSYVTTRLSRATKTAATPAGGAAVAACKIGDVGTTDDSCDNMAASNVISENDVCICGNDYIDSSNKMINKRRNDNKPVKLVKIQCEKLIKALIDSGSDINLITCECYSAIGSPECNKNNNITITGLGSLRVSTLGQFTTAVEIDNHVYHDVSFFVVPNNCIPYEVILGHDFLKTVTTIMKDGTVWLKPNDWMSDVCCALTCVSDCIGYVADEGIRAELVQLVEGYQPRQTKEAPIELKITMKDDIPVAQRPRRISHKEQKEVEKQIQQWLEDGIIRVSYSEYASPIVLVRKKDGSLRICIDYRQVNGKMLRDEYPLPIIDDHIDKLGEAKVFIALDLKNGFFHLPVSKDSIKYTSFVTMTGQYEFLRAPFGLATCPKVFTRYICIIFRKQIAEGVVIIFIDDLLIQAKNEREALERLREVLEIAAEYGLQINWKKSQLMVRSVEYLGHVIQDGVVMPSPGKTDAVMKFPEPRNVKQLHSFLGLCSYFRKFIENFATIAHKLTDMLRKDKKFEFNDEHRKVFNILKEKLSSKPVLKIFDNNAETELHTDASNVAYAAILMQKDCLDELHPVHYMSRRTTETESKYSSYELEVLAIIQGIKKFRHYIFGKHFKIVTDCKAFQMTINKKDMTLSTKVARWILFLQDYDFTIEHRSGSKMRHADALSRNPYVAAISTDIHQDLRRAQEADDGLKAIMEILKDQKPYKDFYLQNGLLCKGMERRLILPQSMEMTIIRKAHENGHFSKKKTGELIGKDYYIDKLDKKIEDCIATCIPCLLASRKEGKQEGFLNPIQKEEVPLHTLHIDHVGPMTQTSKQYNHILTIIDAFTKFVWLFPTKSTGTQEVINKLEIHQQTFGNPSRIITDRGTAFTSNDFNLYCETEGIQHVKITTGVPRGNGQVERVHRTIISVLTKLSIEKPTQWYKHVSKVQRALNSTYQRSINTSPIELLIGTKMIRKDDCKLYELLLQEEREDFTNLREELRKNAKLQIERIQNENRQNYNKKRKKSRQYSQGDLVAIQRTQFGSGLKLKPKFLGPYRITKVKRNNRYDVEKADSLAEGPNMTSTSSDLIKPWPT
jgi:transposase InsO family protein